MKRRVRASACGRTLSRQAFCRNSKARGACLPPDLPMRKALPNKSMLAANDQTSKPAVLLVVEPDERARTLLVRTLEGARYRVLEAGDAPTALRLLHEAHCELILLASEMPDVDGL